MALLAGAGPPLQVSKTGGCRFESCRPCKRKPRYCGALPLGDGAAKSYRDLLPETVYSCHWRWEAADLPPRGGRHLLIRPRAGLGDDSLPHHARPPCRSFFRNRSGRKLALRCHSFRPVRGSEIAVARAVPPRRGTSRQPGRCSPASSSGLRWSPLSLNGGLCGFSVHQRPAPTACSTTAGPGNGFHGASRCIGWGPTGRSPFVRGGGTPFVDKSAFCVALQGKAVRRTVLYWGWTSPVPYGVRLSRLPQLESRASGPTGLRKGGGGLGAWRSGA
jgi:hypothetical protein